MLTHSQIWDSIDALAQRHGLSSSGLARKSGLDATTFNPSKRIAADGRMRWPSTESIAKALEATGESLETFMTLLIAKQKPSLTRQISPAPRTLPQHFPLLAMTRITNDAILKVCFDTRGQPIFSQTHVSNDNMGAWDLVTPPLMDVADDVSRLWAVDITLDDYTPVYCEGDRLFVRSQSSFRRDDRIMIVTATEQMTSPLSIMIGRVVRDTACHVTLDVYSNGHHVEQIVNKNTVLIMARILWVSQ
jgi:phage repressor protein C with HTH and peptisase S24 domain